MMATPVSFYGQTLIDYSNEKSAWRVAGTTLSAANLVAQQALITSLASAMDAITLCNVGKNKTTLLDSDTAASPPTNPDAQREKKWLIRYHGATTNKKFSIEVAGADLSLLTTAPQTDFMDQANSAYTNLKAAWDAYVKSPDDSSESTVMDTVEFVGRRG